VAFRRSGEKVPAVTGGMTLGRILGIRFGIHWSWLVAWEAGAIALEEYPTGSAAPP
jgi:hypothetical protein